LCTSRFKFPDSLRATTAEFNLHLLQEFVLSLHSILKLSALFSFNSPSFTSKSFIVHLKILLTHGIHNINIMPEPTSLRSHLFKNLSLIALSIFVLPFTSTILLLSLLYNYLFPQPHPRPARRQTILVSSLSMGKGLSLARAFHRAGHTVIGVDFTFTHFASCPVPASGRFSSALERYYTVRPSHYREDVLHIIKREGVDLWVPVSHVATTIEDALLKETIERETRCRVFQPDPEACEELHDKNTFIQMAEKRGLLVPVTVAVESREEVLRVLQAYPGVEFIAKCLELDDVSRADMTLLPQPTKAETTRFVDSLEISKKKRWVLQQFVRGREYCTHAVVVRGVVKAFVACESSDLLMQYRPLRKESPLNRAMLAFTRRIVDKTFTGQIGFDFLVEKEMARTPEGVRLFPIECNPRTHTAVVLLARKYQQLADAHLSVLGEPNCTNGDANGSANGNGAAAEDDTDTAGVLMLEDQDRMGQYWIGHELVAGILWPLVEILLMRKEVGATLREVLIVMWRLLTWRDATFEAWDPLPWWWLYQVYYPWMFMTSLVTGKRWSRVNVSTTRVFESY
jgi:catechol O-methyltransferase